MVSFPSHLKKITFFTEILTWIIELWIFSLVSLEKNTPENNFSSVENNYCFYSFYVNLLLCIFLKKISQKKRICSMYIYYISYMYVSWSTIKYYIRAITVLLYKNDQKKICRIDRGLPQYRQKSLKSTFFGKLKR